MTNRKRSKNSDGRDEPAHPGGSGKRATGWKLWVFRLIATLAIPALFFGATELALRIFGYGHPTGFLLPTVQNEEAVFIQNNQFGWRFFGKEIARWPYPFSIPRKKEANTVRILVLGESAARGEPQPDFGLSRLLQTMLNERFGGVRFEVVNTAMTAINSHVILPIARDCVQADADIWIVYMGNNEVVGPFGAGTVFGSQSPPLPFIHANLALKSTRTGQLLDSTFRHFGPSQDDDAGWGGMTMFLDQQVARDDPRMTAVYDHFRKNLADIMDTGTQHGAGVIVSTVAVNLQQCPPFGSKHRSDLTESDKAKWDELHRLGIEAQDAGETQHALDYFDEAAKLDDTFAELRFRQGECALALERPLEARRHFQAACDFDTLRFRCDSRLNELIRSVSANRASERVLLVDAEKVLAEQGSADLSGKDLFYEHAHLTFNGNYLLARTLADKILELRPELIHEQTAAKDGWPSPDECARRLGYTIWHQASALKSMVATINDPPFTSQLHHESQMLALESKLGELAATLQQKGIAEPLAVCEAAAELSPEDPILHKHVAALRQAAGDYDGALSASRRELELLPSDADGWSLLGSILTRLKQPEEAASAFRRAFQSGPQGIRSGLELAGALTALGKSEEAVLEYERILRQKPHYVPALLQLGQLLEHMGRQSEAERCFQKALNNRGQRLPELIELGGFFESRGAFQASVDIYLDAIKLSPADPRLRLGAVRNLASLGRFDQASVQAAEAVRLSPDSVEARLLYGIALFKQGQAAEAIEQFQAALQLRPDSLDARLNLGMALARSGHSAEALPWFEEVLERSPTNQIALEQIRLLKGNQPGP